MLLNIDHWAKKATPITANTDDNPTNILSGLTPHIIASVNMKVTFNKIATTCFTCNIRDAGICIIRPDFAINLNAKYLDIGNNIITIAEAII